MLHNVVYDLFSYGDFGVDGFFSLFRFIHFVLAGVGTAYANLIIPHTHGATDHNQHTLFPKFPGGFELLLPDENLNLSIHHIKGDNTKWPLIPGIAFYYRRYLPHDGDLLPCHIRAQLALENDFLFTGIVYDLVQPIVAGHRQAQQLQFPCPRLALRRLDVWDINIRQGRGNRLSEQIEHRSLVRISEAGFALCQGQYPVDYR